MLFRIQLAQTTVWTFGNNALMESPSPLVIKQQPFTSNVSKLNLFGDPSSASTAASVILTRPNNPKRLSWVRC